MSVAGPWERHRRFSGDGTWDTILAALLTRADAAGQIDWTVSVDSTINRAHQHGTNLPREPRTSEPTDAPAADAENAAAQVANLLSAPPAHATGGSAELQGSAGATR